MCFELNSAINNFSFISPQILDTKGSFQNNDLGADTLHQLSNYRKVLKFSDARKLCYNLPKTQTKRPNLRVFCQKDANGIANSENPDQTAPLGAV